MTGSCRKSAALRTRRPRCQEVARKVDGQRCGAPGESYTCAAVPVVMHQEFFGDSLCFNFESFGTIGSEADYFTNDAIAGNFDRLEAAIRI